MSVPPPSTLLSDSELVKQAVDVLMRELGPVEAIRFLAMNRRARGLERGSDSVQRHREWQDSLDPDAFFAQLDEFRRRYEAEHPTQAANL